jgi:hypothetical protein
MANEYHSAEWTTAALEQAETLYLMDMQRQDNKWFERMERWATEKGTQDIYHSGYLAGAVAVMSMAEGIKEHFQERN